ncbi:hypothetical protein E3N88_09397 [Mikania micrantha]|uniref:Uncharacterized protein n=1 Tax=Mikania micrantha TaxID=192012 RepID=A0A5N6PKW6_9ASTR|nr:hypothetical protein E3N88_09397 [Mikania micrantha]
MADDNTRPTPQSLIIKGSGKKESFPMGNTLDSQPVITKGLEEEFFHIRPSVTQGEQNPAWTLRVQEVTPEEWHHLNWGDLMTAHGAATIINEAWKTLGKEPGKRAIKGRYKSIKERGGDRPTTYKTHIKESIRFQRRGEGPYARKEDQNSLRFSLVFHYMFVILCKRHSPDDVWIEDDEKTKWDELREILSCGKEGSIVVITTRSQVTTRMVTTFSNLQHELGFLSKDDSWLLFKHFAFAEGRVNGGDISELEPIGREIVDICKGLPLAIKTLGSSMWSKTSASEWERVKRNTIWEENKILTALKLSCDNLVPYLKRCFAYCGLFPKGYEMEKDDMIQLWIVNGFVPPREGVELYVVEPGVNHVIIPDEASHLSSSFTEFQFSTQDLGKTTSLRNLYKLPERLGFMRKLHHLHIYGCYSLRYRILSWFPVCDDHICGAKIEELGNLNLIEGELEILGLQNVKGGSSEAKSANLSCKRNLLHLGLNWSHTKMFDSDKQVLEGDKQVLEGLEPNRLLKILKISGYEGNIISPSWMANLRNLVEIQLYWCKNCEHLPPTLVRLPNLKFIKMVLMDSLKCFHDEKEEIMFLCLQELDISMCENLVFLPKNIPKLKILKIRSCDKLVSLACSFPNLEVLKVTKYKELGYLPDNLLKLKNLYLNGCNKILSLPKDIQSFKDMKELVILGCKHLSEKCKKHKGEDWSKISHISDIEIEVTST